MGNSSTIGPKTDTKTLCHVSINLYFFVFNDLFMVTLIGLFIGCLQRASGFWMVETRAKQPNKVEWCSCRLQYCTQCIFRTHRPFFFFNSLTRSWPGYFKALTFKKLQLYTRISEKFGLFRSFVTFHLRFSFCIVYPSIPSIISNNTEHWLNKDYIYIKKDIYYWYQARMDNLFRF